MIKSRRVFALSAFLWLVAPLPSHAIEFWHSDTVWAGQGMCSATFTFDSGMEEVVDLKVSVNMIDSKNRPVGSGVLVLEPFGQSNADRYAIAHLEGEPLCDDDLTVVVTKATARVDGQPLNLLASNRLSARAFRPFKINFRNQ